METLLVVAVILTALAIIVQAGALISMYLMSRRLSNKADVLMTAGQRLMPHFETITNNLKSVSNDLAETGKIAREQPLHVQRLVTETHQNIRDQIVEVRERVLEAVDEARTVVMPPLRQYSAMATAVAEGVRTFFKGREKGHEPETGVKETIIITEDHPAA